VRPFSVDELLLVRRLLGLRLVSLRPNPCEPGDFTGTVAFNPSVGKPAELAPLAGT
jgi:hypothetical protein